MFPALANCTYLNTAGSGILSTETHSWRARHDNDFLQQGSNFRLQQAEFLESVKDTVATFFHGDRRYTYLVQNFSTGFNTLLNGLAKEHRFLLLENEFPAVYFPVQSRGFATETIPMEENLEERIIAAIKRFQPTIFAFSMVQYSNGLKLDVTFLHSLKELFPDLILIADGTQYCGTELFDFMESPLDALLASGYKWMLGGYGNGFVLLKENFAQQIYNESKNSVRPTEAFLAYKDSLTLRFEPGHLDTLAFGTLQQSLMQLDKVSMMNIKNNNRELGAAAKQLFSERNLLDNFIANRPIHSTIFKLNISDELVEKISQQNIVGTMRGKGLRVSFHYYNQMEDLQKLVNVIDEIID